VAFHLLGTLQTSRLINKRLCVSEQEMEMDRIYSTRHSKSTGSTQSGNALGDATYVWCRSRTLRGKAWAPWGTGDWRVAWRRGWTVGTFDGQNSGGRDVAARRRSSPRCRGPRAYIGRTASGRTAPTSSGSRDPAATCRTRWMSPTGSTAHPLQIRTPFYNIQSWWHKKAMLTSLRNLTPRVQR